MKTKHCAVLSLFFTFLFLSCNKKYNYIRNYYPNMYIGIIEYEKNNYLKAYNHFNLAFANCPARNTKTFYEIDMMAKTSAIIGKDKTCYTMIKKQLNNGFTISKYTSDSIYNLFFAKKIGKKLIMKSDKITNEYFKSIDTSLYNTLVAMSCNDQKNRGNIDQLELDIANESLLIKIFEQNKFPKESLSRYKNNSFVDIHTILLHTRDSIRINYFLPKIKGLVIDGKCDPYIYASLYDQYYLYNNLYQIYGTYKNRDRTMSNHISIDSININRLNIGLPTLEQNEEIHNLKIINYPDSYGKFYKN